MPPEGPKGINSDYRFFSEAAKEAGIYDRETRKIIFEAPSLFLDEMSPELKSKLTPGTLTDLFRVLAGKGQGVDSRSLLTIGNVLYEYRPNAEQKSDSPEARHIQETDRQKIDLAFVLIENAVYEGRLSGLTREQMAALAFTVNTMGKLFLEGKAEGLRGFNQEKFSQFVGQVEEFETRYISGDCFVEGDYAKSIEDWRIKIEKDLRTIELDLQNDLNLLIPEFKTIIGDLSKVFDMLKKAKVANVSGLIIRGKEIIDLLKDPLFKNIKDNKNIVYGLREKISKALNCIKGGISADMPKLSLDRKNIGSDATPSGLDYVTGYYRDGVYSSTDEPAAHKCFVASGITSLVNGLVEEIGKSINKNKKVDSKSRVLSGFGELSTVVAQDNLPECLSILNKLSSNQSLLCRIDNSFSEARRLIIERKRYNRLQNYFNGSIKEIKNRNGTPAVAYAIKTILIAGDMVTGRNNEEMDEISQLNEIGKTEDRNVFGGNFDSSYYKPQVHSFLKSFYGDGDMDDIHRDNGSAYANLHYIPAQIPFSVFAWRFIKSKTEDGVKK